MTRYRRRKLVNGGFTVVGASEQGGTPQTASQVVYADAKQATQATDERRKRKSANPRFLASTLPLETDEQTYG